MILAIDPGPQESAWVLWDGSAIHGLGKTSNEALAAEAHNPASILSSPQYCVIEMIASYGMPVGAEVFECCVWIGRFMEVFSSSRVERIPRIQIKNHLCHTSRAKDSNIRQALIDRFGPVGTKKNPGKLYGVSGDCWSALAVGVTFFDQQQAGTAST